MNNKGKPAIRRYFFDTEFNDAIGQFEVDFISIGIVDEKGGEYYGISNEFNLAAASSREWIKENVIDKLDDPSTWKNIEEIRQGVLDMIEPADTIEFWAKNGSYDNVLLCQLFGGMGELRRVLREEKGIRKVAFRDIHELKRMVDYEEPAMEEKDKHIAINDARNERDRFKAAQAARSKAEPLPGRNGPHPGY